MTKGLLMDTFKCIKLFPRAIKHLPQDEVFMSIMHYFVGTMLKCLKLILLGAPVCFFWMLLFVIYSFQTGEIAGNELARSLEIIASISIMIATIACFGYIIKLYAFIFRSWKKDFDE